MPHFFQWLSSRIRRPVHDTATPFEDRARTAAFLIIFGAALALFSFLFVERMRQWENAYPAVTVEASAWRYLPNASTQNDLWQSAESRYAAKGVLKQKPKRPFWVGFEFGPKELKKAKMAEANELVLGWAYGDFEVWINGDRFATVPVHEKTPVVLTLPPAYLAQKNLKVAVLIRPSSDMGTPDRMAEPWREGLATAEQATAFKSAAIFWKTSRPFALFFLNALFAVLFFLFWSVQKKKQEYVYFAIYGAISTFVQLRLTDLVHGRFTASQTWALDLFLYLGEGTFGLLMALSFARSRKEIFQWGILFALLAPLLAYYPLDATNTLRGTNKFLQQWYVPLAHLLGAFACVLQAWELKASSTSPAARIRILRLFSFAVGLTAIALFYTLQAHDWISPFGQAVSSRFAHFMILFLLASVAMREYREEKWLLERVHISNYHRMNPMPELISGALLAVDIKNSERLFEISSRLDDSGSLVDTCLSHLWSAVSANGGTVLQTEGDGLKAFFDKSNCMNPVASALNAVDQMKARLDEFKEQLQCREVIPKEFAIEFRAGIAVGEIKPSWQQMDNLKVAGWSDSARGPFVESTRLMEVERQLPEGNNASLTVLTADAAKNAREFPLAGEWIVESRRLLGKHDRIFLVSAYKVRAPHSKKASLKIVA